jgi:hypothetical protein
MNAVTHQPLRKETNTWQGTSQVTRQHSTFGSFDSLGTLWRRHRAGCAGEPVRLAQQGPLGRPRPALDRLRPRA